MSENNYLEVAERFKEACPASIKRIIEHCYLLVELANTAPHGHDSFLQCGIYAPESLAPTLYNYKNEIYRIAAYVGIEWVVIIETDYTFFDAFKRRAIKKQSLDDWRKALEILWVLSYSVH